MDDEMMPNNSEQKKLELFDDVFDPNRENRLCVSLSDIHLTDGSVGLQNLGIENWEAFYVGLSARCKRNDIKEVTFILDGDVVDMIRSSKWAENEIYPWQRDQAKEFSRIVNEIIQDIVEKKHKNFFQWLQELPQNLERDTHVKADDVKIVILLGNHDKELYCDQKALTYFYEKGLGKPLDKISDEERHWLGRMYGDETMFADKTIAPYFPFYYGDRGFRFFTTHGHWRDNDNSRKIKAAEGLPGWSSADGWQNEVWQQLKFSPFFLPCFGDTVAAGVLSTFICKVKTRLLEHGYHDKRLMTILDELDLYRPTYKALTRIIDETNSMRAKKCDHTAIQIIENTLFECVIDWLSWDFTYESSPLLRRLGLKIAKCILKLMKLIGFGLEIKSMVTLVKMMMPGGDLDKGIPFEVLQGFPAFLPEYREYGFQIHGEGHTHQPLEEEPRFDTKNPTTYINFGTWRDQIIGRKNSGYRRRGVLRVFYILDLKGNNDVTTEGERTFNYYTDDIIKWSDKSDALSER